MTIITYNITTFVVPTYLKDKNISVLPVFLLLHKTAIRLVCSVSGEIRQFAI